jgi:C1A family cysteine protease
MAKLISPQDDYEKRELFASPKIKSVLTDLRKQAATRSWTFEVGYTSAMDHNIEDITGLKAPENWLDAAKKQVSMARAPEMAKSVSLDGCVASASSFNWADHAGVTGVRDQASCGSCWAFATHGAFEGSYAILNNALIDSSEQGTLDCSGAGDCNGGWWAFQYLIDKGSTKETEYPYVGTQGACKTSLTRSFQADTWGYVDSTQDIPSIDALKQALCNYGPLAVAVAVTSAFQAYKSGVFNESSNADINHGVTLIGWDDTKKAWRIKNSWGTGWGESGFMWIAYGSNKIGYAAAWVKAKLGTPPPAPCQEGPTLIAYEAFNWPDNKRFSSNANVASLTFTLPREMYVSFVAESSVVIAQGNPPQSFRSGLYTGAATNVVWTSSYRQGSFLAANQYVPVHTSFAMKFPAGTYTVYWKIWLNGYTIQFGSGTLTALAVPCSMGGQLQVGMAPLGELGKVIVDEKATITTMLAGRPDLYLTIDRSADDQA